MPEQRERFPADPSIEPKIRVITLVVQKLLPAANNALIGQMDQSNILEPGQDAFAPFLGRFGITANLAYAVSLSATNIRGGAQGTLDNDNQRGVDFTLDGATFSYRFFNVTPGAVAIHASKRSMTALHEFGHAFSSFNNGFITDLYVDSGPASNTGARHGSGGWQLFFFCRLILNV